MIKLKGGGERMFLIIRWTLKGEKENGGTVAAVSTSTGENATIWDGCRRWGGGGRGELGVRRQDEGMSECSVTVLALVLVVEVYSGQVSAARQSATVAGSARP